MLNEIIENKKKEVEAGKKEFPLDSFKNKLKKSCQAIDNGQIRIIINDTSDDTLKTG